jgi:hypothetical protein
VRLGGKSVSRVPFMVLFGMVGNMALAFVVGIIYVGN